jgi:hypothetical protein
LQNITVPAVTGEPLDTEAVKVTAVPAATEAEDSVSDVAVASGATVKPNAGEVLVRKVPSPGYTAVRLSVPPGRAVVASVATPDALRVPVPSVAEPLLNVTVSPAVTKLPSMDGLSVAVSVTVCPKVLDVGDAVKTMAVLTGLEVRGVVADRLEAKLALPG